MNNITISLAGKQYDVVEPAHGVAREWRKQYGKPLIEPILGGIKSIDWEKWSKEAQDVGELIQRLAPHLHGVASGLMDLLDVPVEALFAFVPSAKADQAQIEQTATSSEVIGAMIGVARVAYPLESLPGLGQLIGSLFNRDTTKKN